MADAVSSYVVNILTYFTHIWTLNSLIARTSNVSISGIPKNVGPYPWTTKHLHNFVILCFH